MRRSEIKIGGVYMVINERLGRVIRKDGLYYTTKGPRQKDVPYNYETSHTMRHPTVEELQQFLIEEFNDKKTKHGSFQTSSVASRG